MPAPTPGSAWLTIILEALLQDVLIWYIVATALLGDAEHLVIRFTNKDEPASILFSCGKPGARNINKQVLSVAKESSGYYVPDEVVVLALYSNPNPDAG